MLICEEMFLLMTTDEGGKVDWGSYLGYALTASLVADLVVADRIALGEEKDPKVQVLSTEPLGIPILDTGLEKIAERDGKAVSSVITGSKNNPNDEIVDALSGRGVIAVEPKRMLGLVPEKHPTLDDRPERGLRRRLADVLRGRKPATVADVTLLSVLRATDADHKVLEEESGGLPKKELKERIEHLTIDEPTGDAIRSSIDAMTNTLMFTTMMVPIITSSGT